MDFLKFSSFPPQGLLSHLNIFDFKKFGDLQNKEDSFFIYLDENNIRPKHNNWNEFESNGFYKRVLIQDLPIRGKAVYLNIRRRK